VADNTILPGTGETYAAKEIGGGIKYQKVLTEPMDGRSLGAFGRRRICEPVTLFASKMLSSDKQPLFWDEALESGSGITSTTPTQYKPYIDFVSTDSTAGVFTRQTFRRFDYQPGKSQLVLITGVLELSGETKTGCERRIGYFDDDNGLFFASNAGEIGVTIRTSDSGSAVDTVIYQSSWNIDKLDGSETEENPSKINADWSKGQIFVFDFQWLSLGRVRFGVEIDGIIYYVHESGQANNSQIPWCSNPNLPIRYQMVTTASSGVCSMRVICSAVISEGGTESVGVLHRESTAGASVETAVEGTLYAVVGIRLKSDRLSTTVEIVSGALQVQSSGEYVEWVILFNPSVSGTFTYSDLDNSDCQTALGATVNTVTGGTEIGGGYSESSGGNGAGGSDAASISDELKLGAAIDGTRDQIVLCVRGIGGSSSATVEGGIAWKEL